MSETTKDMARAGVSLSDAAMNIIPLLGYRHNKPVVFILNETKRLDFEHELMSELNAVARAVFKAAIRKGYLICTNETEQAERAYFQWCIATRRPYVSVKYDKDDKTAVIMFAICGLAYDVAVAPDGHDLIRRTLAHYTPLDCPLELTPPPCVQGFAKGIRRAQAKLVAEQVYQIATSCLEDGQKAYNLSRERWIATNDKGHFGKVTIDGRFEAWHVLVGGRYALDAATAI